MNRTLQKKLGQILSLAAIVSLLAGNGPAIAAKGEPARQNFQVGQPLQAPGITLPQGTVIVEVQRADVTGDRVPDDVLLVGKPLSDNPSYYRPLSVVVRDGKSGQFSALPDTRTGQYLAGYEPSMFIGDFSGDKVGDVMVTVATGGSGGTSNHLIATWTSGKPSVIFGEQENQGLKITGKYLDGFKAELYSPVLDKSFLVDVSGLKEQYIQAKVYDASGKYIYRDPNRGNQRNAADIFSDPFSVLTPTDVNQDGVYELRGMQSVWGPFHVLTFTQVASTWAYRGGKWQVTDAQYTLTYPITAGK
ncbi:hypothetical protein [Brevibacillus fulvus]|uniref:VCBS repeat-containing protein n=1 Tax=Brevibacillus fulvus TaxID=1125967 RepID=A0A938XVV4_9BACL|nr:hypothetical protein [Brevibacillus fulvus]MBM7591112.1 hypothetical protein [Brevibacillus fulvus]